MHDRYSTGEYSRSTPPPAPVSQLTPPLALPGSCDFLHNATLLVFSFVQAVSRLDGIRRDKSVNPFTARAAH